MLIAGIDNNGRGAKAIGLANALVAVADNPWALYYNPAGLSSLRSFELSVFYLPQQFGLTELQTVSLATGLPTSFGTVAAAAEQFGFELYRETQISLGMGKAIDWGISGGFSVHLTRISIDHYGAAQAVTLDIGLVAQLQQPVQLGFGFRNLLGAVLGTSTDRLPQVFSLGVGYMPVKDVTAIVEGEKDIRYPLVVKAAVEQRFLDLLALRAGVSNNPDKFSMGIGIRYSPLEFSYAGYSHAQLGWTHQIEITFR
jgi:hypothetical protein